MAVAIVDGEGLAGGGGGGLREGYDGGGIRVECDAGGDLLRGVARLDEGFDCKIGFWLGEPCIHNVGYCYFGGFFWRG